MYEYSGMGAEASFTLDSSGASGSASGGGIASAMDCVNAGGSWDVGSSSCKMPTSSSGMNPFVLYVSTKYPTLFKSGTSTQIRDAFKASLKAYGAIPTTNTKLLSDLSGALYGAIVAYRAAYKLQIPASALLTQLNVDAVSANATALNMSKISTVSLASKIAPYMTTSQTPSRDALVPRSGDAPAAEAPFPWMWVGLGVVVVGGGAAYYFMSKKKVAAKNSIGRHYNTYYETGNLRDDSLKIHRKKFASKQKAFDEAKRLSLVTGGYVAVERKGFEVASFYNGRKS